mmetsp:Transcript_13264/g.20150  ORF Transcript_13264/g.20150 Transcript_13264/m.20150 type:complete len:107 (-) Transcript_13264:135-455(-)
MYLARLYSCWVYVDATHGTVCSEIVRMLCAFRALHFLTEMMCAEVKKLSVVGYSAQFQNAMLGIPLYCTTQCLIATDAIASVVWISCMLHYCNNNTHELLHCGNMN